MTAYPFTPDGRYFVVKGRLWRATNPKLSPEVRQWLTSRLMKARRDVGAALRSGDKVALTNARRAVERAKRALGERGPAWWSDGAPDFNRHLAKNTPYRDWAEANSLTATTATAISAGKRQRTSYASAGRRRSP